MAAAGSIVVDLLARTGSFETDMQRAARTADREAKRIAQSARKHAQDTEKAWVSASSAIKGALGLISVGAVFTRLIQNTVNAADEQAQLAAVLRSTGEAAGWSAGQLNELAARISRMSTLSAGEINKAQTALLAFTGIVGDQFTRALQAAVDMSSRTGMSVVAAAETIGRALDIPSQGLNALSRQGFRFTDDQKRLAKQLEETGRTAEAQGIILDSLAESYGGAATAARNTLGGALASLANTVDDLLTGSDRAFQPIIAGIETLTDLLGSGHADVAIKAISISAAGLAVVISGRLVGALAMSVVGFSAATAEATRYQVALASMAGVSRAAAIGIGGMTAAARVGSSLLSVLGGPVGLVVTLGLAGAAMLAMGSSADTASTDLDRLSQSLDTLNREQLALRQQQADEAMDRLVAEATEAERALASVEREYRALHDRMEQGRGITPQELENVNKTLVEMRAELADANQKVVEASALQDKLADAARNAAGGVGDLNSALVSTNEAGTKYLERLAGMALLAGATTEVEKLNRQISAGVLVFEDGGEAARKLAAKIDASSAALKSGSQAAKDHASALKSLLDTHLPVNKALTEFHKSLGLAAGALKSGKISAQEHDTILQSLAETYAKVYEDAMPAGVKAVREQLKAAQDQSKALQQQIRVFGLAESTVTKLTAAETRAALAKLEVARADAVASKAGADRIAELDAQIEATRRLYELQQQIAGQQVNIEALNKAKQAQEAWVQEWQRTTDQIGQSLTDALLRGFEDGKSFAENFRDTMRNMFKTLVLRPMIEPVMQSVAGSIMGYAGSPGQASAAGSSSGGGMMNAIDQAQRVYGQLSGGASNMLASGVEYLGGLMGSEALGSFAAGMKGATLAPGLAGPTTAGASGAMGAGNWVAGNMGSIMGYGSAIMSAVDGQYGTAIGQAIGTYILPGIGTLIGGFAGSLLDGVLGDFGGEDRSGGFYSYRVGEGSARESSWAAGNPGAELNAAVTQVIDQTVGVVDGILSAVGSNVRLQQLSLGLENSDKGRGGTMGYAVLTSGHSAGAMTKGVGHGGRSGSLEEMFTNMQVEASQIAIQALQADLDQLPGLLRRQIEGINADSLSKDQADAILQSLLTQATQVNALTQALENLPFPNLIDLTFDVTARLLELGGGLEMLTGNVQGFYQNFYSETERHEILLNQVRDAFAGLNVEMPASRDALRQLIEAQDLSTAAGQEMWSSLMQLQGAFAAVVPAVDATAAAVVDMTATIQQQLDAVNRLIEQNWQSAVAAGESAYSQLTRSVNAEKSRLQKESQKISEGLRDAVTTASESVSALNSLVGRLNSTLSTMTAGQPDQLRTFEWAQGRVERALSVATLTGVMPTGPDFETALQVVANPSEGLYDSFEAYYTDYLKTAHTVSALSALAGEQLSTEERSLRVLNDQLSTSQAWYSDEIARLDALLESERQRLDIAMGTYQAVLTIPEGIAGITAAISALAVTARPPAAGGNTTGNPALDYLAANPDVLAAYQQYGNGRAPADFAEWHYDQWGRNEGRSFAVGTNYVPYDMKAQIHAGERIIPAADNRQMFELMRAGVDQQGSWRLMQQEVRELRLMLQTLLDDIARNTQETASSNAAMADGRARQSVQTQPVVMMATAKPGQ